MTDETVPTDIEQIADCGRAEWWFTYHPPHASQIPYYGQIRDEAKKLALTITLTCPRGIERDAALNHLRAAVMFANAGIACSAPQEVKGFAP
jgi:hypothetical protein